MSVQATNAQRAMYNNLKKVRYPGKNVTPGYLRLEVSLQSGALNALNFNVLENAGTTNVTERRLKIADAFVMDRFFFGIFKAGATVAATQAEIAVAQVKSYPNPQVFTAANEAANLMNYYNGFASIRVNQTVYVDSMDLMRFYRVATSQQGVGPAVTIGRDEWNDADFAMDRLVPSITFDGGAANYVQCTLPASINMAGTATQNFAVFIARGFLVQNGSSRGVNQ